MSNDKNKYDLEERTVTFGKEVIQFCKKIPRSPINDPLINQFVKYGTSIGANYSEADNAESKLDFNHKIGICKKEAKEAKYWAIIIADAIPELKKEALVLWQKQKN